MRKIISLVLATLLILAIMPHMPVEAGTVPGITSFDLTINSETTVVNFAENVFSGTITIGSGAKSVKIIMSEGITEADLIQTTGACVIIQGGRTEPLELTLENFKIKPSAGKAGIDFGSAGNLDNKLYIKGNCIVAGSGSYAGIHVPEGAKLTIDKAAGVASDAGADLKATGGDYAAGIGGNIGESGGTINICGGTITAESLKQGAGIGGGAEGSGGTTNISGGTVTAIGGTFGAGIGGGWEGTGGVINISGGTVTANGAYGAAGIGGGRESYANLPGEGDGGIITISGGSVTAAGSVGAGIGGGWGGSAGIINISGGTVHASSTVGAGIGNGSEGTGGTINITGGTIVASGGYAGIGGGGQGSVGTITITGAAITATGGRGGAGIGGGGGESGGTISIGGGTITASSEEQGAGIGGGSGGASGNIVITGGVLAASGGSGGAGIGGGYNGAGETISISGGTLNVTGGYSGAGIGGGGDEGDTGNDGGTITISGGTVISASVGWGAGIGGGNEGNGGTITINGGSVTASCGNGSYDDGGKNYGAGIGGGNRGAGGTITINAGTVTAKGGWEGAGIGGGAIGTGGAITINDGTVVAVGGGNGAGIGGGRGRAGGTVTIGGGSINTSGGHGAAGIGGGNGGAGGDVTIANSPVVISRGDVDDSEYSAQHIGRGYSWSELDSGTLRNTAGASLSYLRFNTTDTSGSAFPNVKVTIKGIAAEYYTNGQGQFQTFVPYTQPASYEVTVSKAGYASVKYKGVYSTSHDFSAQIIPDNAPPALQINPLTQWEADVTCNDYGVYGTLYFVPKGTTDYTSKAALDLVTGAKTINLESPQTTCRMNVSGLSDGKYQIYAVDSAENVSVPLNIVLPFPINNDSVNYSMNSTAGIGRTIPADSLMAGATEKPVEIKTELATVILPSNMLTKAAAGNAKSVVLSIERADIAKLPAEIRAQIGNRPVIQLRLMLDGKAVSWSNPDAPVTVSIPYKPTPEELKDPEHITVWYIDGEGNVISVPSGRYEPETGNVTFTTTHFSCFAIVYVKKTFSDINKYKWAKNQIEVLASKGIINGSSKDIFSPGTSITRADYLVQLVNTMGLSAKFDSNFDDVKSGSSYYEAVGTAKKLGITSGSGGNKFNPKEYISRQDMMVLTARALASVKKLNVSDTSISLDKFSDKRDIAGYAVESMAALIGEELIAGSGDRLYPRHNTTRAEAAVFLYRIYNKF